ncbi:hypothetical protein [Microlunatus sp. GCM10028923]|uniref:hypothetical protein n=1 Tax=Microlunatus sp. GCM10028923 TaxID=3273400 RepID=UPI00362200B1
MERSSTEVSTRSRLSGALFAVGGAGWMTIGVISEFFGPFSGATFVIAELVWMIIHFTFLAALIGLLGLAASRGRLAQSGIWVVLVGRVAYVAGEAHCLSLGSDFSPLLPIALLITTIGMILAGVGVLRARAGRGGWAVLIVGVYPLLLMFPLVILGSESLLGIAGWGIVWAVLGVTLIIGRGVESTAGRMPATGTP